MKVTPYSSSYEERWDALVADAPMATLLHTRRFLAYHGDRFEDCSLLFFDDDNRLAGLLPAARVPSTNDLVASHPGASYGGIVHAGQLLGENMIAALSAACDHYRSCGFARFLYKAVPSIYHAAPAADDLYALFRLNAVRTRTDLSAAIDLERRGRVSQRRTRGARKAVKLGATIQEGSEWLARYWPILERNLSEKHDVKPVHSLEEIGRLAAMFPDEISCVCTVLDGEVAAGAVLFECSTVSHAQYIASSSEGRAGGALDYLFESLIARAAARGKRYFDFGISNEDQGRVLNSGLYRFKSEFGASGILHEFYEINLI